MLRVEQRRLVSGTSTRRTSELSCRALEVQRVVAEAGEQHLLHLKPPAYPGELPDSGGNELSRPDSSLLPAPSCQFCRCRRDTDEPRRFPCNINLCPRETPAFVRSLRQPRCTNGGGTPKVGMRPRIAANRSRGTATWASWNVTYLECRTTFAPILINISSSVVNDQC